MKKLLLAALIVPVLLASCSSDGGDTPPVTEPAKGSIRLSTAVNNDVDIIGVTRAEVALTDLTGYTLTLNGTSSACPSDGIVDELEPGTYSVGLSNLPASYAPAFNDPRYAGTKTGVSVVASETATNVEMKLTQANAGIYFVYDGDLADDTTIVPVATDASSNALTFSDTNRNGKGYFAPGTIAVAVNRGGETIKTEQYQLQAAELLEVTIKYNEQGPETGGIAISAKIITVTDPTDQETIEIERPSSNSGLTIDLTGGTATAKCVLYHVMRTTFALEINKDFADGRSGKLYITGVCSSNGDGADFVMPTWTYTVAPGTMAGYVTPGTYSGTEGQYTGCHYTQNNASGYELGFAFVGGNRFEITKDTDTGVYTITLLNATNITDSDSGTVYKTVTLTYTGTITTVI